MTEDLAVLGLPGAVMSSSVALEIDEKIRFNDWKDLGRQLSQGADRCLWQLADWALFGLEKVKEDPSWLIYRTMIEAIYAKGSYHNLASVARRVEPSRRREDLSFTHHVEVARLEPDEQEAWLADAVRQNWSTRELREELDRSRGHPAVSLALSFRLVDEHYQMAIAAAERRDMDPKDWVLEAIREKRDREALELEAA